MHGGKLQDAESEFHLELQLDSANEPAWLGLAEAALAQRQADAALKNVAKAWEVSPELLAVHREFPTIELAQDTAKALIEKLQALSSDEAPLHFLLASLYAPTNENLQSDGQWKAFNAGVLAWKERSRSSHPADMEQEACKAHRYSECVAFLQRVQPLNNSQRLLLGKLQFDLRDYQSATDSLAKVTGVNGAIQSTVTDAKGVYHFPALPPGAYAVKAALSVCIHQWFPPRDASRFMAHVEPRGQI